MFGLSDLVAKLIGTAILVLAIFGFGYYKGHAAVQAKFDEYKNEVKEAADIQTQNAAKKDKQNAKIISETKSAYNSQLTNLRDYYGVRVNKSGSAMSKLPHAAAGVNDYSPDNLPPTPILAAQCAEETLKLIKLQEFNAQVAENME